MNIKSLSKANKGNKILQNYNKRKSWIKGKNMIQEKPYNKKRKENYKWKIVSVLHSKLSSLSLLKINRQKTFILKHRQKKQKRLQ